MIRKQVDRLIATHNLHTKKKTRWGRIAAHLVAVLLIADMPPIFYGRVFAATVGAVTSVESFAASVGITP